MDIFTAIEAPQAQTVRELLAKWNINKPKGYTLWSKAQAVRDLLKK